MVGQTATRLSLERTAGEAPNCFPRQETLYMDLVGCIPFSVRGAKSWTPVSLGHPARVELYDSEAQGQHKVNGGATLMKFPSLNYEDNGNGLTAILGEPEYI